MLYISSKRSLLYTLGFIASMGIWNTWIKMYNSLTAWLIFTVPNIQSMYQIQIFRISYINESNLSLNYVYPGFILFF